MPYPYTYPLVYADELPAVTTQAVTDITGTTATGNGNVTTLGEPAPTAHGVCYNTTGSPTVADDTTNEGAVAATGAFTTGMTSLTVGVLYYVKAYATNANGTVYGSEVTFRGDEVVVYPSESISRATNLIHRYNRKGQVYTLEMYLGEVTSDFGLPEWLSEPMTAEVERGEREIMEDVTEIRNEIADELGVIQARTEQSIMREVTELRNQIADELGQIQKRAVALAPSPTFIPETLARIRAPAPAPAPKRYTLESLQAQAAETRRRLEEARRKLAESMPGW